MRQHITWRADTEFPYIINLSEGFTPYTKTKAIPLAFKKFNFLGGEPHFQITSNAYADFAPLIITQRFNSIGDLFDIILANDAARRMGFKNIHLVLPYFPAARQDRVCNEGEPLTIKVFTDMINGCGFNSVGILTPHSEVTPALINNVYVIDELPYINRIVQSNLNGHQFNVVCPDAGAGKRVGKIVQYLQNQNGHVQFNLIRCEKVRDVKDGSLKGFFVQADDLGGHPSMIVDDIVAMGGTFIGLGEELKKKNAGDLMLYTAHADCALGLEKMCAYFTSVFTSDSKLNWDTVVDAKINNLGVFKIAL